MNGFEIIWKLEIFHPYFTNGKCRVIQLSPQPVTLRFLNNQTSVFKQIDLNEWIIAGDRDQVLPALYDEKAAPLAFDLTISDPQFLYYTPSIFPDPEEDGKKIRCTRKPDTLKSLSIHCTVPSSLPSGEPPFRSLNYRLSYPASERYWEYILISRSESTGRRNIFLNDTEKEIPFGPVEAIEWQARPAYLIRTTRPVHLKEYYSTNIQLYEKRSFGKDAQATVKRLLCRHIPPPVPGQFPAGSSDTLRQVIYF